MTPREVRASFFAATRKIRAGSHGRKVVTAAMTTEPLGKAFVAPKLKPLTYKIGDRYIRRVVA